jgi:hypothetical protein
MYQFDFGSARLGAPRLPKLKEGFDGLLLVKQFRLQRTRQWGDMLFVEFDVVQSNLQEHPVGQRVVWKQAITTVEPNTAAGAIFRFAAACFGIVQGNEAGERELQQNVNAYVNYGFQSPDNNYFTGKYIRCFTRMAPTRTAGRTRLAYDFFPYVNGQ